MHTEPPADTRRPGDALGQPRASRWRDSLTALRRVPLAAWNEDATERAAALTYYTVLAFFPTLLVTVSLIGIAGVSPPQELISEFSAVVPADSQPLMRHTLSDMSDRHSAAWLLVVTVLVAALWSSSSYLAVFRRALHTMYAVKDNRPAWRAFPRIVVTAAVLLALLACSALALLVTGELARATGQFLGADTVAVTAWNTLKWPLLLALAVVLVLVLFRSGPAAGRRVRRMAPGGTLAVLLWLMSSAVFALYVDQVGTYSRIYGSLAGSVIFLVWMWVANISLLLGAHFNAELFRLRTGGVRGTSSASSSSSSPSL